MISGVVLAAGTGTRFGGTKQLGVPAGQTASHSTPSTRWPRPAWRRSSW